MYNITTKFFNRISLHPKVSYCPTPIWRSKRVSCKSPAGLRFRNGADRRRLFHVVQISVRLPVLRSERQKAWGARRCLLRRNRAPGSRRRRAACGWRESGPCRFCGSARKGLWGSGFFGASRSCSLKKRVSWVFFKVFLVVPFSVTPHPVTTAYFPSRNVVACLPIGKQTGRVFSGNI